MEIPIDVWNQILDYAIKSIDDVLAFQTVNKWWYRSVRERGLINIDAYWSVQAELYPGRMRRLISQLYNIDKMKLKSRMTLVPGSALSLHVDRVTPPIISRMTTLRDLVMEECNIAMSNVAPRSLRSLKLIESCGSNIQLLTTSLTKLDIISSSVSPNFPSMTRLLHLRISGCELGVIPQLSQLQTLRIPMFEGIVDLTGWTSLTRLDISTVLDESMILGLIGLRDLSVYGNNGSSWRACYDKTLLEKLPLTILRMSHTLERYSTISIPTLRSIVTLFSFVKIPPHVTLVSVTYSYYVPQLHPGITSLKLRDTLDAYSADDLIKLTSLTYLDLRQYGLSYDHAALQRIASALPSCTIRQ